MVGFRQNLGYKLLALMLSVSLWGYVHLATGTEQKTLEDTIELRNVPKGIVARPDTDRVKIVVSGPGNRLEDLSVGDIETWVDMKLIKTPGFHRLPIRSSMNRDPDLLSCRAEPGILGIDVQDQLSKKMTVKAMVSGTPPIGYSYSAPEVNPASVSLHGLRKDVSRVRQIIASVDAGKVDVDQQVKALPLDSSGQMVSDVDVEPAMVRVLAPLQIEQASRQLLITSRLVGQPAPGYRIVSVISRPQTAVVRGSTLALESLNGVSTRHIDINGIKSTQTFRVPLLATSGVEVEPDTVQVVVEVQALQETPLPPRPPSVRPATTAFDNDSGESTGNFNSSSRSGSRFP